MHFVYFSRNSTEWNGIPNTFHGMLVSRPAHRSVNSISTQRQMIIALNSIFLFTNWKDIRKPPERWCGRWSVLACQVAVPSIELVFVFSSVQNLWPLRMHRNREREMERTQIEYGYRSNDDDTDGLTGTLVRTVPAPTYFCFTFHSTGICIPQLLGPTNGRKSILLASFGFKAMTPKTACVFVSPSPSLPSIRCEAVWLHSV